MEIQRRAFLGSVGAGALAASREAQASAAPAAAGSKWDVSWAERLNRKHRAVFDSTAFANGGGLFRAVVWKHEYKEVYGTAPEDMNAVLVVRRDAVWLAMNDAFWKTYDVGQAQDFKAKEPGKFRTTNPVASASPNAPPEFADMTIPKFVAGGDVVLACHRAFGEVVALVKKADKLATDEEAEAKARTFVLPGVILQPSGVFATLRAQEAGCQYILAS